MPFLRRQLVSTKYNKQDIQTEKIKAKLKLKVSVTNEKRLYC